MQRRRNGCEQPREPSSKCWRVPSDWLRLTPRLRLPPSRPTSLPIILHHSRLPHLNTRPFAPNTRVSPRSHTRCIAVTIRAITSASTPHRSSHVSVRNTRANMSAVWGNISPRFRRAPAPPLRSPVADLPYDEAIEATASMVEQWKMEQPSLPDLEVQRSVVGSLCCADCFCRAIFQNRRQSPGTTAALAASQYTRSLVACTRAHETGFARIATVSLLAYTCCSGCHSWLSVSDRLRKVYLKAWRRLRTFRIVVCQRTTEGPLAARTERVDSTAS